MKTLLLPIALFTTLLMPAACAHKRSGSKVVSFKNEFEGFWKQAKNQPFEKRVELWTSIVEQPHRQFFDSVVWSQKSDPKFPAKRLKQLAAVFSRLENYEPEITKYLQEFDSVLDSQMMRYRKVFPEATFPVRFYGVLGGNFLGRVDVIAGSKEKVLAFGIDKIAEMKVRSDVLYSHELFHVYHGTKSNVVDGDARMLAQLWTEGLASFVSSELNPGSTKKDIFIYESTARIGNDQLPRLASSFMKVAARNAFDPKDEKTYFDWFLAETDSPELPAMAGYWLGYKVVESLRPQYSLAEMSEWDANRSGQETTSALKRFGQQPSNTIER